MRHLRYIWPVEEAVCLFLFSDFSKVEDELYADAMAKALFEQRLQRAADALGAMESQCSQNQNRFKRRGQFWSKGVFASFVEAYVWYVNDELKYLYRRAS